ncbi:MAG: DUF4065 domain-containing protein [Helicobacteraceae bacterium]|nr:DUF4065 domain-containing protein [Helicobacteraceae bacterium]
MEAIQVANAFLNKIDINAIEEGAGIHKVKLQKLLFFAQDEFLYRFNKPLFNEKIEAWEHGPVVREVWNHFQNSSYIINEVPDIVCLKQEQKEVIDFIWGKYGGTDAWVLRDISHSYKIWRDKRDPIFKGRGEITQKEILDYRLECEKAKNNAIKEVENLADKLLCGI